MRAAASLGATPVEAVLRVMLPIIAPGVVSGALFAFVTSFDEVVIALFIAGSEQRTLPRQMWSGVRETLSPTIAAVAALLILFSTLFLAHGPMAAAAGRAAETHAHGLTGMETPMTIERFERPPDEPGRRFRRPRLPRRPGGGKRDERWGGGGWL